MPLSVSPNFAFAGASMLQHISTARFREEFSKCRQFRQEAHGPHDCNADLRSTLPVVRRSGLHRQRFLDRAAQKADAAGHTVIANSDHPLTLKSISNGSCGASSHADNLADLGLALR